MPKVLPIDISKQVLSALVAGESMYSIAKRLKIGRTTVSRIAAQKGIVRDVPKTKNAIKARTDYAVGKRLELLNLLFDKAQEMAEVVSDPRDLQILTVAVGTLIDKRRLEDGEATSRNETNHQLDLSHLSDEELRQLAKLAERVSQTPRSATH